MRMPAHVNLAQEDEVHVDDAHGSRPAQVPPAPLTNRYRKSICTRSLLCGTVQESHRMDECVGSLWME